MNGFVTKTRDRYKEVNRGHGYAETNLEGERLLETVERVNLK